MNFDELPPEHAEPTVVALPLAVCRVHHASEVQMDHSRAAIARTAQTIERSLAVLRQYEARR